MKFCVKVMTLKVMLITPKWRMFKLLGWVHLLNRLVDLDEILYCDNSIKDDLDHSKMAVCLCVPRCCSATRPVFPLHVSRVLQNMVVATRTPLCFHK
jgi:hypothetical protein